MKTWLTVVSAQERVGESDLASTLGGACDLASDVEAEDSEADLSAFDRVETVGPRVARRYDVVSCDLCRGGYPCERCARATRIRVMEVSE